MAFVEIVGRLSDFQPSWCDLFMIFVGKTCSQVFSSSTLFLTIYDEINKEGGDFYSIIVIHISLWTFVDDVIKNRYIEKPVVKLSVDSELLLDLMQ
jgi:hypothetical protein